MKLSVSWCDIMSLLFELDCRSCFICFNKVLETFQWWYGDSARYHHNASRSFCRFCGHILILQILKRAVFKQYTVRIKGTVLRVPNVCQENIPHITAPPPAFWHKAGWIHGFMLFTPNSDTAVCMWQQKLTFVRPGDIFCNLLLSSFGVPASTVASVSCS